MIETVLEVFFFGVVPIMAVILAILITISVR